MATLVRNQMVQAPSLKKSFGTGWVAPVYGRRDYTHAHAELASSIRKLGTPKLTANPARNSLGSRSSPGEGEASMNKRPVRRIPKPLPHLLPAPRIGEHESRLD